MDVKLQGEPTKRGTINLQVYDQGKFWWDLEGKRHEIALMPTQYRDSILNFLRKRADAHAFRLDFAEEFEDVSGGGWGGPSRRPGWQENTPLFIALKKRPETLQEKLLNLWRNALDWAEQKRGF